MWLVSHIVKDHCDIAYIDERELKKEKEAQKNRRIAA